MIIPYLNSLQDRARELRKQQTVAEHLFWQAVRNRKCLGYKFYRQRTLLSYIVDFYCRELALVIEIDGDIHLKEDVSMYDTQRTMDLESQGLKVIRYTNDQVMLRFPDVLKDLKDQITLIEHSPSRVTRGG